MSPDDHGDLHELIDRLEPGQAEGLRQHSLRIVQPGLLPKLVRVGQPCHSPSTSASVQRALPATTSMAPLATVGAICCSAGADSHARALWGCSGRSARDPFESADCAPPTSSLAFRRAGYEGSMTRPTCKPSGSVDLPPSRQSTLVLGGFRNAEIGWIYN